MAGLVLLAIALVVALEFLGAWIVMLLWNVVVPYFGGPHITYWVSFAACCLLVIIGNAFRSDVSK